MSQSCQQVVMMLMVIEIIFHSSRPPKIPIDLYHYPWFIFSIALHCISFLVLYCIVVQCIIVCLAF